MPTIGKSYVDVDEFVSKCDDYEVDELIATLKDFGYLSLEIINLNRLRRGESEKIFEKKLHNLHGKWNLLSKKDEEKIIKISERV